VVTGNGMNEERLTAGPNLLCWAGSISWSIVVGRVWLLGWPG
jgi:hypothetical protein